MNRAKSQTIKDHVAIPIGFATRIGPDLSDHIAEPMKAVLSYTTWIMPNSGRDKFGSIPHCDSKPRTVFQVFHHSAPAPIV